MHRLACLLRKETLQLRRNRSLFGILLITPVIQLIVLGSAATTDIREIRLAVRDQDHSFHSREYVRALGASGYFRILPVSGAETEDDARLIAGRAGLLLTIPADFSRKLLRDEASPVQVLVDGADSNFGVQGLAYFSKASHGYSERLVPLPIRGARAGPAVAAEPRAWYNPDLVSRYFMIPAVMGVLLLVTTMIVTSMSLVKEREEGTMEQIIVTPLRPAELIVGKLLPFVAVGFAEITLALIVTMGLFRVPLHGSLLLLYFFSGLFLLTTLGLGLFVSTLVKTQQQAMLLAAFFIMMPFILLSGFIFPVENMPKPFQVAARFIPLKYYLTIVRGIFQKGAGCSDLWREGLVLLAWGLGILALAVAKFHKRLD